MEELTGMREASALEGKIDQVVRDEGLGALILDLVERTDSTRDEVKEIYPFSEADYPIYLTKHLDHFIVFVLKDEEHNFPFPVHIFL
jgi:hypothetical protein